MRTPAPTVPATELRAIVERLLEHVDEQRAVKDLSPRTGQDVKGGTTTALGAIAATTNIPVVSE